MLASIFVILSFIFFPCEPFMHSQDYPGSQHNPTTSSWGHTQGDALHGAHNRLNTMLDMPGGEQNPETALAMKRSKFGLGDRRTLDDLINFSGIDLRHRKVTIDGVNRCGNLQWVPFIEHPKGVNFIPSFNETTEDPLDLPYEKTSVWYDPRIDGIGADLVSRESLGGSGGMEVDKDLEENRRVIEKAAHIAHRLEADRLAGGSLHDEHKALAAELEAAVDEYPPRRVITNAEAAALKAEEMENEEVHAFPPLLRGGLEGSIPKGRFFLPAMKVMSKHGVEHLPIQVQISVACMVLGICVALISSATFRKDGRRSAKSKKHG